MAVVERLLKNADLCKHLRSICDAMQWANGQDNAPCVGRMTHPNQADGMYGGLYNALVRAILCETGMVIKKDINFGGTESWFYDVLETMQEQEDEEYQESLENFKDSQS